MFLAEPGWLKVVGLQPAGTRWPLALSLVGRRVVEYLAPQVMLHVACSLLRRIKCQLWNHLKDQGSVFLIRPKFWEELPLFYSSGFMFFNLNCGQNNPVIQRCRIIPVFLVFIFVLLNTKAWIWSFSSGLLPVRAADCGASAANGILFWVPTKLFSPSSILQEESPDTQQSANPLPMATRSPVHR